MAKRPPPPHVPLRALTLPALAPAAALAEIRRLYFRATARTIQRDLETAVALLTRLDSEEDRERATVYMQGLTDMRKEWAAEAKRAARPRRKR